MNFLEDCGTVRSFTTCALIISITMYRMPSLKHCRLGSVDAVTQTSRSNAWSRLQCNTPDHPWQLPMLQEYDPDGAYIRKWVPELRSVPPHHVHAPWRMSRAEQAACGVAVPADYPTPLSGTRYTDDQMQ